MYTIVTHCQFLLGKLKGVSYLLKERKRFQASSLENIIEMSKIKA
jgi:hypothetical protein